MASIPSASLMLTDSSDENQKLLSIDTVRELVAIINQHIHSIIKDNEAQKALKLKCTSKLKIQAQEFFEFSEHSVLSNLFWGMENVESSIQSTCVNERIARLEDSEKMLQIPASLDENGTTLGISNNYIICCSYFYLCLLEYLRSNEWQVAMHLLQALIVSPRAVYKEFVPGICKSLFPLFVRHKGVGKLFGSRRVNSFSIGEIDNEKLDDVMRSMARRYKPWLVYYQIMSSGEFRPKFQEKSRSIICSEDLSGNKNEPRLHYDMQDQKKNSKVNTGSSSIKCLKDILTESEPDSPVSLYSSSRSSAEEDVLYQDIAEDTVIRLRTGDDDNAEHYESAARYSSLLSWKLEAFTPIERMVSTIRDSGQHLFMGSINEIKARDSFSRSFSTSFCEKDLYAVRDLQNLEEYADHFNDHIDGHDFIESIDLGKSHFQRPNHHKSFPKMKKSFSCHTTVPDIKHRYREDSFILEQSGVLEKIISKICFTEGLGHGEEDYASKMKTIYEMLNSKTGLKYSLLKDIILDQLLTAITTSREDRVVRTSVAILSTIVTTNRSVIEDIKRKGLQLYDLATALKRNVHEAAILIYLINPPPSEIKTLELLPCLVEVVCTSQSHYKVELASLFLTPPAASLMMIEVLVTAFDCETNGMHLAAISSPRVLTGLLRVPRKDNLEEFISLAAILVNCMRFDGKCRKHISEISPVASFVSLLWSNQKRATSVVLEFFNELLRMPRSSAIGLLEQIQKQGSINNLCALFLLAQNSEPEYRLLAANLLLHLEVFEDTSAKTIYREEAIEALLESLTNEDYPNTQSLSAFIVSNLGGTYSWTGEPYTMPWLVKKTGLALANHKNLIKNTDFLDECLQDSGIEGWNSKIAQRILNLGTRVFDALDKGLKSKLKRVSRDCLVATAWLGCELLKGSEELRHAACEIVLHNVEQYLHPGSELEERLLACLCIYNYTSGRGMKKIINLSEGVRESLRRLSSVTWMAEELLKVADYFQPNKWRISCVHSQVLEAGNKSNGAVTALIYYKGLLHSGYSDGSIKVWDIKGHAASLVQEVKEHKKAVSCFALYEPGNCLLSGSADKTIKIWQMIHRSLECIEVISVKESIRAIDSSGELIFATMHSHKLKVIDASRKAKDIFKNKRVKCARVAQGKLYAGCADSSIQELMISNNRHQEIKAPSKSWMQNKPICAISVHKDWLYSASHVVEGSKMKEWRRGDKPQVSIMPEKGSSVLAMEVVEDFIYLNCSSSMSSVQIWLRGTQHKVGRLSAGSKITSLLSANDMILCGTDKGVIKGWLPL